MKRKSSNFTCFSRLSYIALRVLSRSTDSLNSNTNSTTALEYGSPKLGSYCHCNVAKINFSFWESSSSHVVIVLSRTEQLNSLLFVTEGKILGGGVICLQPDETTTSGVSTDVASVFRTVHAAENANGELWIDVCRVIRSSLTTLLLCQYKAFLCEKELIKWLTLFLYFRQLFHFEFGLFVFPSFSKQFSRREQKVYFSRRTFHHLDKIRCS